ncbi:MAG: T9SS type A sorting domain-containing protein [Saprospiraceae bacterium]|nr:T9SS type A sorting domain-containing protein [Saprospiraceae bacterium]
MLKNLVLPLLFCFALNLNAQTWADDVACIVYSHCSRCHSPGNIGPFSLMSYQEAYDARFAMQYAVTSRNMPPWKADPNYGAHAGKRLLTDEEVALIDAWVNNDAPAGNLANAPAAPVFNSTEEITNPDLTVQIPNYTIPSILNNDLYRVFAIPVTLPGNRYITGLEVVPGNRSVVHHVLVYQDDSGQALAQDAADPEPGYTAFGGIGVFGAKLVGAWVPGSGVQDYPTNMGVKISANTAIVLQIHYPVTSVGQSDNTKVNLRLSDGSMREVVLNPVLNHVTNITNGPFQVVPNEVVTFHEEFTVGQAATLFSIAPHAHLICTSMKAFGITLLGDTIPLIDIPNWDFHWQGAYRFQKPVKIPALTKLHGYATYDNTSNNPHNPNSPPQAIAVGEATTDEMMLFYLAYTGYQAGDENIVVDTSSHLAHHLGCETHTTISGSNEQLEQLDFKLFPNPAGDFFTLETSLEGNALLRLTDFSGRPVLLRNLGGIAEQISIGHLPNGIYTVSMFLENGRLAGSQRLVVLR